jgi:hypothetical protein
VSRRLSNLVAYAGRFAPSQAPAWILAGVGLAWLARRRDRFPAFYLGGWALVNAVGVSASGYYFPHYFQQLLPAVASLAAATLAVDRASRRPSHVRVALVSILTLGPLVLAALRFWALSPAEAMQTIYPGNAFQRMPALAREIASVSEPEDTVFIFGTEPELLFYARRVSASRYHLLFPLFGPYPDALERQRGVAVEVARAQPAVLVRIPDTEFFVDGAPQFLTRWFRRFSAQHYRPHAFTALNAGGGVDLVRIPQGTRLRDALQGRRPQATIFVRKHDTAEPSAPDRDPSAP